MSIKVGINGFGRIGRMVMRCCMDHPNIEIVGVNDLCPADYLAYMLKFDTMHGKFKGEVSSEGNNIVVNGKAIPVFAERDPANLPWAKVGAEYVIESTGLFLTKEKAAGHIAAGAKHVVMSAPSKDDTPMSLFVKLSMDGDTGFAWNKILALSLISILPQLIVFFCAQDQFVEGISAGAVKG